MFLRSALLTGKLMNISEPHRRPPTHLFTLRLWSEVWGEGQGETRIQVKHVLSGETRYFREWTTLLTYLQAKMHELDQEERPEAAISTSL